MTDHPHDHDEEMSLLDELRGAFAAPLIDARLYKRLPARGQGLVAEYRVMELDEALGALDKPENLAQAQDVLVQALQQIMIHRPGHDDADERGLVPLHVAINRADLGPLKFDHRLCDVLGMPATDARDIVLALFDGNQIALAAQATALGEWSEDTRQEHLQDFGPGS